MSRDHWRHRAFARTFSLGSARPVAAAVPLHPRTCSQDLLYASGTVTLAQSGSNADDTGPLSRLDALCLRCAATVPPWAPLNRRTTAHYADNSRKPLRHVGLWPLTDHVVSAATGRSPEFWTFSPRERSTTAARGIGVAREKQHRCRSLPYPSAPHVSSCIEKCSSWRLLDPWPAHVVALAGRTRSRSMTDHEKNGVLLGSSLAKPLCGARMSPAAAAISVGFASIRRSGQDR